MLLVYAMTRATEIGWGSAQTIGLLAASTGLIVSFVVIELRSKAPLLPMRIFRLRSLTGANVTSFLVGASVFSQFFLGTLYMQQVLHFSAIETGVAYLPLTLTIIVLAGVAQNLVTRIGVRRVLPVGMAFATVALVLLAQVPADGHYFSDLFVPFLLSAVGLAFAFVPLTIAALMGVEQADAGVASGLLNTTQQIGGAIGLAAASTIATTFTAHYVTSHPGASPFGGPALTYGFQIAFYVLAGLAALGAVLSAVLIEPQASSTAEPALEIAPVQEAA
jgi:predicted MFS family arabinose efflux permease